MGGTNATVAILERRLSSARRNTGTVRTIVGRWGIFFYGLFGKLGQDLAGASGGGPYQGCIRRAKRTRRIAGAGQRAKALSEIVGLITGRAAEVKNS